MTDGFALIDSELIVIGSFTPVVVAFSREDPARCSVHHHDRKSGRLWFFEEPVAFLLHPTLALSCSRMRVE
jgi:hypothetical protein